MSIESTVASFWTSLNNAFGAALPMILLVFLIVIIGGITIFMFIIKKYDYDVFVISKSGMGGGYKKVQGIMKGNQNKGYTLKLTKINRTIAMVSSEFIVPPLLPKTKPVIFFEQDAEGNLSPLTMAIDDAEQIVMYPVKSEDKFWYVQSMKQKDDFTKIVSGLKDIINIVVIIILAMCFVFFLIYMNKTAVQQTQVAFEAQTGLAAQQAAIAADNRIASEKYAQTQMMFVYLFSRWAKSQGVNLGMGLQQGGNFTSG